MTTPPVNQDILKKAEQSNKPKASVDWTCPLCGSREHDVKTRHHTPEIGNPWSEILYYTCAGCSILFGDPQKFNHSVIGRLAKFDKT